MDNVYAELMRALIRPGIFLLFGLVFLWAWSIERKRSWIPYIAIACLALAAAWTAHLLAWPGGIAQNAVFSGFLYTLAVVAACEGLLLRAGKRFGLPFDCAILVSVTGLLWVFTYPVPSLWARVYIQNFGYGAMLLFTSGRLAELRCGRVADRLLFWVMLGFSVQFFVRTSLTLGLSTPAGGAPFIASPFWNSLQLSLTVFGSALAFAVLIAAVTDMMEDLRRERDSDPLTMVLNRRGLDDQARRLFRKPEALPISVILCDIDHFKSINDTFGHDVGDKVLRAFGALLKDSVRPQDVVARTGGEEFTILIVGMGETRAIQVAERIRSRFKSTAFRFEPLDRFVTASFGVAEHQPGESLFITTKRADSRLYDAKRAGRDRVVGGDGGYPAASRHLVETDGGAGSRPSRAG